VQNIPIFEENGLDSFKGSDVMRAVRSFDPCLPCGDRVRLKPKQCANAFELCLVDAIARITAIEQDYEARIQLAVAVESDPGGRISVPPVSPAIAFLYAGRGRDACGGVRRKGLAMTQSRVLFAGIGNIFCGDDAFGVEVAQRLSQRALPDEVHVRDFGIGGLELA